MRAKLKDQQHQQEPKPLVLLRLPTNGTTLPHYDLSLQRPNTQRVRWSFAKASKPLCTKLTIRRWEHLEQGCETPVLVGQSPASFQCFTDATHQIQMNASLITSLSRRRFVEALEVQSSTSLIKRICVCNPFVLTCYYFFIQFECMPATKFPQVWTFYLTDLYKEWTKVQMSIFKTMLSSGFPCWINRLGLCSALESYAPSCWCT